MRTKTCRVGSLIAFAFFLAAGAVNAQRASTTSPTQTLFVRMSDGTRLATDLYVPVGKGPFPAIVVRLPYNKDGMIGFGSDGRNRGYAVVIQDTRGRYSSGGENWAFEGDGWAAHRDGYDTLEWTAAQPWCNGKIGTFGGSALAITQLMAVGAGTKRVAAQIIQVGAPSFYHDLIYPGGVFRKALVEDWTEQTRHDPNGLKLWLSHPDYDDFWRDRDLTGRFGNANAAAVHVGGWYDIFTQGTIDSFLGYQTKGGPRARGNQKLIMGPWTHGIFQGKAGELTYRNGNHIPGNAQDMWKWFGRWLKGEQNGVDRDPAVTYYVMGDAFDASAPGNEWRTCATWPPPNSTEQPYYLHDDRSFGPTKPAVGKGMTYSYDPKNPAPTDGGRQLTVLAGPRDQKPLEGRADVLSFSSEPLTAPIEVTGRVKVHLWASSDCPDTDFAATLCDVYPDGRAFNVCEGIVRARFHNGFDHESLLKPGNPYAFTIDLWSTSIVFNKKHRLRLLITSSSFPGYDPNPNTGASFRSGTATRVAHNTVLTFGSHASYVGLPIVMVPPVANRITSNNSEPLAPAR